jgi:DNA-binding winged helix-turn-helix (wHTH) protein/TolB-like protein
VPTPPRLVRFGVFEFDLDSLELRKQGARVAIEPQPARALALLLQSAGEVVSRDTLKHALWNGGVHVDFDRGLAYVIGQVRSALGDSADNPRFVETLPKRGFRFIAPVGVVPSTADQAQPLDQTPEIRPPQPVPPSRSPLKVAVALAGLTLVIAAAMYAFGGRPQPVLAVAIFDNETGQPQFDRFTNSLPDALIAHLGAVDPERIGLIGNARTLRMPRSQRDLTQIREETGASFILLGQLQTLDSGIRLITHLIRLEDGKHVWVKRFDRPTMDVTGFESEVLPQVEEGVRLRVIEGLPAASSPSPAPASR